MDALNSNLKEISALNPWSERMLSLIDLIKLDTLPLDLAAYLMNEIRKGASVLVGARAGRAGKTTLMGALLGIIPSSDRIITIENAAMVKGLKPGTRKNPKTYVIHEISNHGPRHGPYLWGSAVAEAARLVGPYTRLLSCLHADNIAGVKATFRRCGAEEAMYVFDFIIFIQYLRHDAIRVVNEVWKLSSTKESFKRSFSKTGGLIDKNEKELVKWEKFLTYCLKQDILAIDEVAYALREYAGS